MSTLRQATGGDLRPDRFGNISSDSIKLELDNSDGTPVEPLVEDFPFEDPREFRGTVQYRESSPLDGIEFDPEKFRFRYRAHSGLFLIEEDIPILKARMIFRKLSTELEQVSDTKLRSVRSSQLDLWSFVFSAKQQQQVVIRDFEENEVHWEDIPDLTPKELARNYALDRARLTFYHDGNRGTVSYEKGVLNFNNDSDSANEYILQQFEKYVTSDKVLEELV